VLEPDTRYTGWAHPEGWVIINLARCQGCGQPIAWARTPAGRSAPLDRDGVSHFATCPEADRFRRRRAQRLGGMP
jgi:hypothetical protein